MSGNDTVLVFIPSLVAQLLRAEREKGAPLSEAEVLKIRDGSECVAMHPDDLPAMIEQRGYEDVDPERCWEEWQKARIALVAED